VLEDRNRFTLLGDLKLFDWIALYKSANITTENIDEPPPKKAKIEVATHSGPTIDSLVFNDDDFD
jgi:hypothetical protein